MVGPGWVRFDQTWGGRTVAQRLPKVTCGRRSCGFAPPVAWTTLELTLHADGQVDGRLVGASPFPRHWVYDTDRAPRRDGRRSRTGRPGPVQRPEAHTPWGEEDSPAFVTTVQSALESGVRSCSCAGARPAVRRLRAGEVLTRGRSGQRPLRHPRRRARRQRRRHRRRRARPGLGARRARRPARRSPNRHPHCGDVSQGHDRARRRRRSPPPRRPCGVPPPRAAARAR